MIKKIIVSMVSFFVLMSTVPAFANLPYVPIQFPRDEAAHYENVPYPVNTLSEWWYYNGDITTTNGKHFGYYLSYFYVKLDVYGETLFVPEFMLQLSDITDQSVYGGGELFPSEKTHFDTNVLNVSFNDKDTLKKVGDAYVLTGAIKTKQGALVKFSFQLTPVKEPLMVGNKTGLVDLWDGDNSYYYSVTHMKTTGELEVDGQAYQIDSQRSLSWMDHQWGDFIIAPWNHWIWSSVQLDNGMDINLGVVMDEKTGLPKSSNASIVMPDNSRVYVNELALRPVRKFGEKYPYYYELSIPALDLRVGIENLVRGQDSNSIWEGISSVSGMVKGTPVRGYAYAENTIKYK
jgi:predicted secreted hydrolase